MDEAAIGNAAVGGTRVKRTQDSEPGPIGGEGEDRAAAICPALLGRAIEPTVAALDEAAKGIAAVGGVVKNVQDRETGAVGAEGEDRVAINGRAIEPTVAALDQPGLGTAAVGGVRKRVQDRETCAVGAEGEDRAKVVRSAIIGRAIEPAVAALDQPGLDTAAVGG